MAANPRDSNSQLLHDLDTLTHSLYQQPHASRRTNSLVLTRSAVPEVPTPDAAPVPDAHHPRSRRMSMTSPFRSRPKSHQNPAVTAASGNNNLPPSGNQLAGPTEKKGIWNWKPMRALSHIGMHRLGCLFSVEAVAAQGLPHSMNGLRLAVAVRKKETKEGAVRTMPSRVLQGSADFEETLFLRCHLYCSGGPGTGKPLKFEPRPFLVTVTAIDAPELDFGSSAIDLSSLVKESMERSSEGERVRQWDATFSLSGKARGGELVLKLGFQIMEDGGAGIIYDKTDGVRSNKKGNDSSSPSPFARKQSKSSFSVTSPRVSRSKPSAAAWKESSHVDLKGLDDFNLDEPGPPPSTSPSVQRSEEPEAKDDDDDQDLPEFEIVDRGVEIQAGGEGKEEALAESEHAASPDAADGSSSVSSEVVKEVVSDSTHIFRLTELDAIAKQIKALESMMTGDGDGADLTKTTQLGEESQKLDANEETVTREFLQMLELEGDDEFKFDPVDHANPMGAEETADSVQKCFLSDLGKGLGPVVRTRDGGYLASTNPFDVEVQRKETPKLAMQISRPIVLHDRKLASGLEVFQKLAAVGSDELSSKLLSLASMDELTGKTAEQIAFEGIASSIITGRSKEGASSSAAKSIAILKVMAVATSDGRKDRISTGIWNAGEEPVPPEEILSASLQRMEAMAVEALKIQAGVAEEEAPFDAAPLVGPDRILESAVVASDDWAESIDGEATVTMLLVVQLRDPLRRYEAVGGPTITVVQAARVDDDEEGRFKVTALHVGGLKLRPAAGRRNGLDGEKERLTAMQWLVAYGLAKAGKRVRQSRAKGGPPDLLWSSSSRVVADMWLKAMRNPDIKVPEKKIATESSELV